MIPLALAFLTGALVVAAYRLVAGPSLVDRVIGLDLLAVVAIGLIALLAVKSVNPILLDAALVIALLAFLSTVIFARHKERQAGP